jgi:hypothetical protein
MSSFSIHYHTGKGSSLSQTLFFFFLLKLPSCSLVQPLTALPGGFHYVFFAMSREVKSELNQCVQIVIPGSSFHVEVSACLSMIKSIGGVEAGSFMLCVCVSVYVYIMPVEKEE